MTASQQKVVQYLGEAHAHERALTRVLQSQIAMTPRGSYRTALETHLRETRGHADRVERRLDELDAGTGVVSSLIAAGESIAGQALALSKAPIDLLRGTGGEEKVLKNAKDAAATEALEIATYTAIERLARDVGDDDTARLAASIRRDEERMLEKIRTELPRLTDAVVEAEIEDRPSYDPATTGAADAVRDAGRSAGSAARGTRRTARRTARKARKVPGVTRAEGQVKGAVASESDLAIARYDALTVDEIVTRIGRLSEVDVEKVRAYERAHKNRAGVLRATERERARA